MATDVTHDEFNEDEALAEGEVLENLLQRANEGLADAEAKIAAVKDAKSKLTELLRVPAAPCLVPVCGGAGFFEGSMKHTNDVLVLLGDNWFAKRSVHQALGIADRRLEFLMREQQVLQHDRENILAQRQLLENEGILDGSFGQSGTAMGAESKASVVASSLEGDAEPFCDDDDLTVDELDALEQEMGSDVNDDELVERRMLEIMSEKRRRRLLAQQQHADAAAPVTSKSAKVVRFVDPSSIGRDTTTEPEISKKDPGRSSRVDESQCTSARAVALEVVERPAPNANMQHALPTKEGKRAKKSLFAQGLA